MVLASVYADATLVTPLANPVTADSGGWFPQIFATEGAGFDLTEKSAAGVTIKTYVNVISLGSNSGTLSRDFTTSRFQARGAGGTTYIEAGDPVGDDVGGTLSLGGWAGTQADLITLNGALINTTGRIKENSKKLPGIVYTPATPFTTAATLEIPLTADPTGVVAWDIEVWDFVMSATANLYARLSYDGGVTYKAGASDYYGHYATTTITGGAVVTADLTEAQMELGTNPKGTAARPGMLRIQIITPPSGTAGTKVMARFDGVNSATAALMQVTANWFGEGSYGKATHLRLLGASGTITGQYRVTPLRGYGET